MTWRGPSFCVHKMNDLMSGYNILSFFLINKLVKITFLAAMGFEGIYSLNLASAYRTGYRPATTSSMFASMNFIHLVGMICWAHTQFMTSSSIELSAAFLEFPTILFSHIRRVTIVNI